MRRKLNIHEGEKILIKSRSSKWFFIFKFLRILFFFTIPLAILIAAFIYIFKREDFLILSLIFFIAIFIISFFYQYILWKDPVFIITNKRAVFEHEKGLFSSKVIELDFKNISGMTIKKGSLIESILGYGTVIILPKSGSREFEIQYMPNCRKMVDKIMKIYTKETTKGKNEYNSIEDFLENTRGIVDFFRLNDKEKEAIKEIEDKNNRGALSVLKMNKVFCVLRDRKINWPSDAICSLPSLKIHNLIAKRFQKEVDEDDILFVGV